VLEVSTERIVARSSIQVIEAQDLDSGQSKAGTRLFQMKQNFKLYFFWHRYERFWIAVHLLSDMKSSTLFSSAP
jgi:hypothetical protein